ncbi:hypothetical protein [Kibdelosporangium phytohabitans]|uniref:hypothetical protein n=1 Tax=Kibdelosporangium phytohabitans TaxID=860235 RepID=UPI0012F8DE6B|nr:hypothetical protein [Kibdelosporangium phytohabitans]MBE1463463.1 hypothetical protein [Kibdelosporangium phytohabitans]
MIIPRQSPYGPDRHRRRESRHRRRPQFTLLDWVRFALSVLIQVVSAVIDFFKH